MYATYPYIPPPVHRLKDLHHAKQTKAFFLRMLSRLGGSSRDLLYFDKESFDGETRSQHYAGIRTVPIERIRGTESRSGDFDCDFNPLHSRTAERWVSIAFVRSSGTTLPPVELIQVGSDYYVRDGHHRISVERAFGKEYIDAEVMVLDLIPSSADPPGQSPASERSS